IEDAGRNMPDVPTFFEAVTAMAFLAFHYWQVDIAVVEVGLGGRLDATNIIDPPCLSVITPVAFDHMDRLGYTIEAIAGEKAGIIKAGSAVVLGPQPYPAARAVIMEKARGLQVPIVEPHWFPVVGPDGIDGISPHGPIHVPLLGAYQVQNVATAYAAMETLAAKGWVKDWSRILTQWSHFSWPGRFQVMQREPLWVIDGAHNPHGIGALVETLKLAPYRDMRWTIVFGALADKPAGEMLQMLKPLAHRVIVTRIPSERAGDPLQWQEMVPSATFIDDPWEAVQAALAEAKAQEAVLATGSLALLGYLVTRFQHESATTRGC
ncbi:MAG: bifunctional folylpolyglutamate synthase/dihydrofolate synthase, partial [Sulfobacillus thermotolerans]|nr:bifunctional folylpolyglutamate synthase/dihydrofolate synthase [Sulfobacillus thermotolerans]